MMYIPLKNTSTARLGASLAMLALGVISNPLAAMEEVTVDGTQAAAEIRAQNAHFRSEMNLFIKTVEFKFKAELAFDLKQTMAPPTRLAAAYANTRG